MVEAATKVLFLVHKDDEHNTVFAVMPQICGTYDPNTMTSYEMVGQHGAAAQAYVDECRLATLGEYAALKRELESIGYAVEVADYTGDEDFAIREKELASV